MRFTVNSSALKNELSLCMAAVENRTTSAISGMIQLKVKAKSMVLCATNLDFTVKTRVGVQADGEAEIVLPVDNLYSWISKVPDGELSINIDKRFTARQGKLTCSVKFPEAVSFPVFPELGNVSAQVPAGVLAPMFLRAAATLSGGNPMQNGLSLDGAYLTIKDGVLALGATNGHRMSRSAVEARGEDLQVLASKKFTSEVAKLATKVDKDLPVSIYSGDNHVYFVFGDRLLYSRALAGRFPDLQRVFDLVRAPRVVTFDSQEALESLGRVATFSDGASRKVSFSANGQLRFSTSSEAGDGDEPIDAEYTGEPISANINSTYVIDYLRLVDGRVEMQFSGNAPVGFRSLEDPTFQYCVARME